MSCTIWDVLAVGGRILKQELTCLFSVRQAVRLFKDEDRWDNPKSNFIVACPMAVCQMELSARILMSKNL